MRTFIGMILGCLLTIAAAYIHDSVVPATVANGTPDSTSNTLVNWDVAEREWGQIKQSAHTAWLKLQEVSDGLSKKGDA